MKKIKTFADACKALKLKASALPDVSMLPEKHRKSTIAYFKLVIIIEALNEGWVPDWSNFNEWKYEPWFKFVPGSGWSCHDYVTWHARTTVGSRLCFKSEELAKYAGKQFIKEYNDYLSLKT